jgi:bifunctional DNase/RNase
MIEATVESIRVSLVSQNRVVILREIDGDRHLPIWIGAYEAEAIAMELQGVTATRPLPYDLLRNLLVELDATVQQVVIADLTDKIFYARIVIDVQGRTLELDSRPSDALAVAVRTGARILIAESIMDQVGVSMEDDDGDEIDVTTITESATVAESNTEPALPDSPRVEDEQLGVFRDFINSLDLDDFDRKRSS